MQSRATLKITGQGAVWWLLVIFMLVFVFTDFGTLGTSCNKC